MYPTQFQASYTEKSYYSVSSMNSIPNNPLHFHSLPSDPSFSHLPPSTIASYPNSGSDPSIVTGYEGQSTYYQDPNAVSANWVVKEAAPVKYSPAVQALRKGPIASTSYDVSLMSIRPHANPVRNIAKRKLKRPKTIPKKINAGQKVRCELCKIECTDIQLYEKHLSGKRHSKNIQKMYASGKTSKFVPATQPINNKIGEHSNPGGSGLPGVSSVPADLETKKQKLLEGGTAAESLKICTVCNVACNGEIAFADHLAGKKHMTQARSLCSMTNSNTNSVSNPIPKSQEKTTKTKNGGFARCEVCNISCTNSDGLIIHQLGKKHKKNLELLKKGTTAFAPNIALPSSTNPSTGVPENIEPTKATVPEPQDSKKKGVRTKEPEDVETKKRKVLEGGAAADSVRMCTVCNVVCNGETVFKSHLSGKKHASMVKQAKAGMATGS